MRRLVRAIRRHCWPPASWPRRFAQAPAATDSPRQPIRMVVTFPPGGSADAVVRMLVPRLNDKLGQSVIVDNRPGAGGNIGLSLVAKAPPDGYTVGVGAAGALSANSSLYERMPFDVAEGLQAGEHAGRNPVRDRRQSVGGRDARRRT
jgi:tripartite-type tricarboxylate transporter receptor subunit TctC